MSITHFDGSIRRIIRRRLSGTGRSLRAVVFVEREGDKHLIVSSLLVLLATTLACSYASPVSLHIRPEHFCPGDSVTLRWRTATEGPYRLSSTMQRYSPPSSALAISDTV